MTDPKNREKRKKLVVMAARGEDNEAAIAQAAIDRIDAADAKSRVRPAPPEGALTRAEKAEHTEKALVELGPLYQALALAQAAGDIAGLKDVAAMGAALQKGARARGMGIVSENLAAEVVIRADRAIGQALIRIKQAGGLTGGQPFGPRTEQPAPTTLRGRRREPLRDPEQFQTLRDLGLTANQSQAFQLVAGLADSEFEAMLAEKKEANKRLAKVDFYRAAQPKGEDEKTAPVNPMYAASRTMLRLAEEGGWENMHVDDREKTRKNIQAIVDLYIEWKARS